MTATATWTTPQEVIELLQRRWDRGDYLTRVATASPWSAISVTIRTPTTRDIAHNFAAVQQWVQRWNITDGTHLRIEHKPVGGRLVGTNRLPRKAWIDTPEQLFRLLKVTDQVAAFVDLLEYTRATVPALIEFVARQPAKVLGYGNTWKTLIRTALWIVAHGTPEIYLRQVDVPGVDTKFIETHKATLAGILDLLLPDDRIDRLHPPARFAARYRLRTKPTYVRFRYLDPPAGAVFTEMTVRVDELAAAALPVTTVLVVENEITYLALPPTPSTAAIFGGGYAVGVLEILPWLHDRRLVYWGDLDTQGFAILDRLRRLFPHTQSILMDQETLLAYPDQWVIEPTPYVADLPHLTPAEFEVYRDLVEDTHGTSVRLEQERISYSVITAAFAWLASAPRPRQGDGSATTTNC